MFKELITTWCGVLLLFVTVATAEDEPVNIEVNDGRTRNYEVQDSVDHGKYHLVFGNHRESHDGAHVVGEYNLKEPNGNFRTVRYILDKTGFHAQVFNSLEDPHFNASDSEASGIQKRAQETPNSRVEDAVAGVTDMNRTSEHLSASPLESYTTDSPSDGIAGTNIVQSQRDSSQIFEHSSPGQGSNETNYILTRNRGTMPLQPNSSKRFGQSTPEKYNNTVSYTAHRNEEEFSPQTDQISQQIPEIPSFQVESNPVPVERSVQPGINTQQNWEEPTITQQEMNQDNYSSDNNQRSLSFQPSMNAQSRDDVLKGESERIFIDDGFSVNSGQENRNSTSDGNEREDVESSGNLAKAEKKIEDKDEDSAVNRNQNTTIAQLGGNDKPKEIFGEGTNLNNKDALGNRNSGPNSYQPQRNIQREFEIPDGDMKDEAPKNDGDGSGQDRKSFHSAGQGLIDEESPQNVFKGETIRKIIDDKFFIPNSAQNGRNFERGDRVWIDGDSSVRVFKGETARQNDGSKHSISNRAQNEKNLHPGERVWRITENAYKGQTGRQNVGDKLPIQNNAQNGRSFQPGERVSMNAGGSENAFKEVSGRQNVGDKLSIQNNAQNGRSFQPGERVSMDVVDGAENIFKEVSGRQNVGDKLSIQNNAQNGRSFQPGERVSMSAGGSENPFKEVSGRQNVGDKLSIQNNAQNSRSFQPGERVSMDVVDGAENIFKEVSGRQNVGDKVSVQNNAQNGRSFQPGERVSMDVDGPENAFKEVTGRQNVSDKLSTQSNAQNSRSFQPGERVSINADGSENAFKGQTARQNVGNKFSIQNNAQNGRRLHPGERVSMDAVGSENVLKGQTARQNVGDKLSTQNNAQNDGSFQPGERVSMNADSSENIFKEVSGRQNVEDRDSISKSAQNGRSFQPGEHVWIDADGPENVFKEHSARQNVGDKLSIQNNAQNGRGFHPGVRVSMDADGSENVFKEHTGRQNIEDRDSISNSAQNGRNFQRGDHLRIEADGSENIFKEHTGRQNFEHKDSMGAQNGRNFQPEKHMWINRYSSENVFKESSGGQNVSDKHPLPNSVQNDERKSINSPTDRFRGEVAGVVVEDKEVVESALVGSRHGQDTAAQGWLSSASSDGEDNAGDRDFNANGEMNPRHHKDDTAYSRRTQDQRGDDTDNSSEEEASTRKVILPIQIPYKPQGTALPETFERARLLFRRKGANSSDEEEQNRMKQNGKQGTHSSQGVLQADINRNLINVYKSHGVEFPSEVRRPLTHRPRMPEWVRDVDQKTIFETLRKIR